MSKSYKINSNKVVYEIIDGEVIAISQENFLYFSMREHAALIWRLVIGNCVFDQKTISQLKPKNISEEVFTTVLENFLQQLEKDALIVQNDNGQLKNIDLEAIINEFSAKDFSQFAYERFDNMVDYFSVDPIHDVSEKGWPFESEK